MRSRQTRWHVIGWGAGEFCKTAIERLGAADCKSNAPGAYLRGARRRPVRITRAGGVAINLLPAAEPISLQADRIDRFPDAVPCPPATRRLAMFRLKFSSSSHARLFKNPHRRPATGCSFAVAAVMACLWAGPKPAVAQSPVLVEIYGRGVHAYHAGRLNEATALLTQAIDNRLQDPRAYYFRGLAAMSQGLTTEAEEDFRAGGRLEATGRFGDSIGRALTRVQGGARLRLEAIRDETRLAALAAANAASDQRYREFPGATAGPIPPAPAAPAPAAPSGSADVPGAPAPVAPAPAAVPPPAAAPMLPPQPPTAPLEDDPFADDLSEPMIDAANALEGADGPLPGDAAPAAPAPAAAANPFGGDAPADPFGAPAPAAGSDPFGAPPANDPFGAPAGAADPFGAMGDDPFGN